ncbi:MAG: xanthine dehydrogenase family protein subunit M [Ramlibacter sp.]|nr:xanthine dehydrogenase family protein subunit M [Ramlibacter sp.]
MYSFELQRPASLADATANLGPGARPLAGGQTLIASLKMRLASPDALVDLSRIPDLALIRKDGNSIVIGSMARHADVASSADVLGAIPALAHLASSIGDRQVRAMGTLGGSIANNDPAADYPAGVLGLGATVQTTQRTIAADQYFQGLFTTALNENELITAVSFPTPRRAAYVKFKQPASRFALTGVFVAQTDAGVRVAVTGGGKGVFRHAGLEAALNQSFTAESAAAVKIESGDLSSDLHGSAAYRANLISVLTQRAVTQALG